MLLRSNCALFCNDACTCLCWIGPIQTGMVRFYVPTGPRGLFHPSIFPVARLGTRLPVFGMTAPPLPRDEREIKTAAARLGLSIPDACLVGVAANLALIDRHVGIMRGRPAR